MRIIYKLLTHSNPIITLNEDGLKFKDNHLITYIIPKFESKYKFLVYIYTNEYKVYNITKLTEICIIRYEISNKSKIYYN